MNDWLNAFQQLVTPATNASTAEWTLKVFIIVSIVITLGAVLSFVVGRLIGKAEKTATEWDDVLLKSIKLPFTLLIWIVGLSYAAELAWNLAADANLLALAKNLRALGVIFCLVLFVWRFLSAGEEVFLQRKARLDESIDQAGVRAVNKVLKASVVITGVLMTLNTMGYSISGVLAFGGIGGIAVGFAAKDLLANFFGGLMVYLDRPFVEGDWIRSPERETGGHSRAYRLATNQDQKLCQSPGLCAQLDFYSDHDRKSVADGVPSYL